MKKIAWTFSTLGAMGAVIAPIASTVSCGSDKFSGASIKASNRTDEEILDDFGVAAVRGGILTGGFTPTLTSTAVFEKYRDYALLADPETGIISDAVQNDPAQLTDAIKKDRDEGRKLLRSYWSAPAGEAFRLALITNKIASLWDMMFPQRTSQVINALLNGVSSTGADSSKLNSYKVALINNIRNSEEKLSAFSSLQKFDGYLNWLISETNNYEALKTALMGGMISDNFMYGVQTSLNFNQYSKKKINAFELQVGAAAKVTSLTPDEEAWIQKIINSPELATFKQKEPNYFKSSIIFANTLIDAAFGPSLRETVIASAIASVWNVPGTPDISTDLQRAVLASGSKIHNEIKTHIADVEKKSLGTLAEFKKFIDSIKSQDNKYDFIKTLLKDAGCDEDDIRKIQTQLNTMRDQAKQEVDILA